MPNQMTSRPLQLKYNYQNAEVKVFSPRNSYQAKTFSQDPKGRKALSTTRYCKYHHVYNHDISECPNMRPSMEEMIVEVINRLSGSRAEVEVGLTHKEDDPRNISTNNHRIIQPSKGKTEDRIGTIQMVTAQFGRF
ncbi:hypothetical protein Fot_32100 [Forsythia ovata]|uniref:Uncharacterized protein n=1 Tax=Forsythia ovata TaxID=205694 RepID=A0ABD1T6U6_9LAMI